MNCLKRDRNLFFFPSQIVFMAAVHGRRGGCSPPEGLILFLCHLPSLSWWLWLKLGCLPNPCILFDEVFVDVFCPSSNGIDFSLLTSKSCLFILETSPLSDIANTVSQNVVYLFFSLKNVICVTKVLNCSDVSFRSFVILRILFWMSYVRICHLPLSHKDFLLFSLKGLYTYMF